MILSFTTFILFTIAIAIVQFGYIAAFALIGILAIVFAGMIGAVISLLTIGQKLFRERKPEGRF